jgi:hypothetical protein
MLGLTQMAALMAVKHFTDTKGYGTRNEIRELLGPLAGKAKEHLFITLDRLKKRGYVKSEKVSGFAYVSSPELEAEVDKAKMAMRFILGQVE